MAFKDFIPAGEDTGALGEGGFRDFIPSPQKEVDNEMKKEFKIPEPPKGTDTFKPEPEIVVEEIKPKRGKRK